MFSKIVLALAGLPAIACNALPNTSPIFVRTISNNNIIGLLNSDGRFVIFSSAPAMESVFTVNGMAGELVTLHSPGSGPCSVVNEVFTCHPNTSGVGDVFKVFEANGSLVL